MTADITNDILIKYIVARFVCANIMWMFFQKIEYIEPNIISRIS